MTTQDPSRPVRILILGTGSMAKSHVEAYADVPGAEPLPIRLGELRIEGAAFHLEDRSIQPPCLFDVMQLDGTVKGLSSKSDA